MPEELNAAAQNTNDAAQDGAVETTVDTAADHAEEPKAPEEPKASEEATPAEFELKLPDGITFDEPLKNEFLDLAKAEGIKPETAQKLVDLQLKTMQGLMQKQQQQFDEWAAESENAYGDKKDDVLNAAAKGLAQFDPTGKLRADLEATGLGNKKEWIDLFQSLGAATKEGDFVEGNPAKGGNFLDSLYPTMK